VLVHLERDELRDHVTGFTLSQVSGDDSMAITGVVVGQSATFQIGFVPSTNFIPLSSGPLASSSDPLVVLGAVGADNRFTATADATDTNTSFIATITGVNDQGVSLTHQFTIPLLPAPPPPPTSITDFSLDQV
jgi:hypothetical protein